MKKNNSRLIKLKIKKLVVSAGRPVAFLHVRKAESLDVSVGDRIVLYYKNKKTIAVVDIIKDFLKENEIALSEEILSYFKARTGSFIYIDIVSHPKSLPFILKKMNGENLEKQEVKSIIEDIVTNNLTEAEVAYFISAVYERGMSLKETFYLTQAMCETGSRLSWNEKKVADKHCIGGIPGNRTTPIVVSICAAAGIIIPKTSSRAITSPAGTADVMETLTHVNLSLEELKKVVKKTGACLVWGGSLGLAPADDKIIRVERLLRIDPESQLISSILAKKIAAGSTHVLIDIPAGKGAKVSKQQAQKLSKKFIQVGKHFGLHIKTIITDGNQPIGNGIGPNLEMRDVLAVLQRRNPIPDLEKKSLLLSSLIIEMVGKAPKGKAHALALELLNSGAALQKFDEIISAQGKKHAALQFGSYTKTIKAGSSGKIESISNSSINSLGQILGCPTDKAAGIYIYKHKSDRVSKGEPLFSIYSESQSKLDDALFFLKAAFPFKIS